MTESRMLYKMIDPNTCKVGDDVIVFSGNIRKTPGKITHIIPKNYGVITRYTVQLEGGLEIACALTELYDPNEVVNTERFHKEMQEIAKQFTRIPRDDGALAFWYEQVITELRNALLAAQIHINNPSANSNDAYYVTLHIEQALSNLDVKTNLINPDNRP